METIVIVGLGLLVLVGLVALYRTASDDKVKGDTDKEPEVVEPKKPTLPNDSTLNGMTKADLDAFAKDSFGVDLDRRKTKAKMIADLKAAVK